MKDKAVIIDFKFGIERRYHIEQAEQYRSLLGEMGYKNIEAYLWYVDDNKTIAI
jgi:hypothetical protein